MDSLMNFFGDTWLGDQVREHFWMWPLMEVVHFASLCVLFGALMVVDLRVIGVARYINMREAMKFIPIALIAFAGNAISGLAFVAGEPFVLENTSFQWKMVLIAIAGINALWFWFGEHTKLLQLADGEDASFQAKVIALLSLLLWIGIIVLGRLIGLLG